MGKRTGKHGKKNRKGERRGGSLSGRCYTQRWCDPGVDFFRLVLRVACAILEIVALKREKRVLPPILFCEIKPGPLINLLMILLSGFQSKHTYCSKILGNVVCETENQT